MHLDLELRGHSEEGAHRWVRWRARWDRAPGHPTEPVLAHGECSLHPIPRILYPIP